MSERLKVLVGTHDHFPEMFARGEEVKRAGGIVGQLAETVIPQIAILHTILKGDIDVVLIGGQLSDCVARVASWLVQQKIPVTVVLSECVQGPNDWTRKPDREILENRREIFFDAVLYKYQDPTLLRVVDWPEE